MILFYISEAIKIFRRASLASVIAIISCTVAVALVSLSIVLLFLSDSINERLKRQIELNIFLKTEISTSDLDSLKEDLKKNTIVGYAKFVSKEEAIERFIAQTGEDFSSILDLNPLPSSFVVRLKSEFVNKPNLQRTISEYSSFRGVDEVKCDFETALAILQFIDTGRFIVYFMASVLIIIALYFVYSTHRMWILSKEAHFNTMKLVGAKISTLKVPIILNGIIIGLIAGIICIVLFFTTISLLDSMYGFRILESYKNLLLIIVFIGGFLGFISSLLSTRAISLKIDRI